LSGIPKFIIFN